MYVYTVSLLYTCWYLFTLTDMGWFSYIPKRIPNSSAILSANSSDSQSSNHACTSNAPSRIQILFASRKDFERKARRSGVVRSIFSYWKYPYRLGRLLLLVGRYLWSVIWTAALVRKPRSNTSWSIKHRVTRTVFDFAETDDDRKFTSS